MEIKVRSDMILRQLRKRHVNKARLDDVFLTEVKNGQSYVPQGQLLILDALAIRKSWAKPCFTGYEVKVSRSDFMRDQKWPGYMQYCHEFYFACPKGLIKLDELPKDVGLIYYNPEKDSISTKRKALYRPIEISQEMLMYIIMSKFDSDRHPFFSSQRELLEAWVKDKENMTELGHIVGTKMAQRLSDLERENKRLKAKNEWLTQESKLLNEIRDVLLAHGIRLYRGEWAKQLDKALKSSLPPNIAANIDQLTQVVEKLRRAVS